MRGRRDWCAVSGALLLVWLGVTTMDGLAQRLGSLSDGAAAPVPPIETATPGPDQRPVPRYGPSWIPPEPEGPPSSTALRPLPAMPDSVRPVPAPKPPPPQGPTGPQT